MLREVAIGWGWEVYVEMFVAGVAAGAYLTAMILELFGRGRSPIARAAHVIALPLALLGTALLIYKLERPDRFWHMALQSHRVPLPMVKWWSPISLGTWILGAFSLLAAVSFLDALVDRRWLALGPWRSGRTLHGSPLGWIWAIGGGLAALLLAGYSGALLSVTAVRGWGDAILITPFFLAVSAATGAAALLVIESIRRRARPDEVDGLARASVLFVAWQLVVLVVLVFSLGGAMAFFLGSVRSIGALVAGAALAVASIVVLLARGPGLAGRAHGVAGVIILVAGFLLRYAVVMGPQHAIQ